MAAQSDLYNYDISGLKIVLDGGRFIMPGIQGFTPGDGLEMGKMQYQAGQAGPMGATRGLFKGDSGYSFKLLAQGGQMLMRYLADKGVAQRGGLTADGIYSIRSSLVAYFTDPDAPTMVIEYVDVQILTPTISGVDSPDSRDAATFEFKFTCTNRIIDGIPEWYPQPL
jgi:hypothetical protein